MALNVSTTCSQEAELKCPMNIAYAVNVECLLVVEKYNYYFMKLSEKWKMIVMTQLKTTV